MHTYVPCDPNRRNPFFKKIGPPISRFMALSNFNENVKFSKCPWVPAEIFVGGGGGRPQKVAKGPGLLGQGMSVSGGLFSRFAICVSWVASFMSVSLWFIIAIFMSMSL